MVCGGCNKKAAARAARGMKKGNLFGGYKYLTDRQIAARLESYKRRFCFTCPTRGVCDYAMYLECPTKEFK